MPRANFNAPNLRHVDLNLFVVFEAIFSEGGLTPAGRKLGLTQPAISHALARLRATLGDRLFVRQGSGVVPTPFSQNIIGDVRQALNILEGRLKDHQRFDPASATRAFHLGLPAGMEAELLPAVAAGVSADAPGVRIFSARIPRRLLEVELASGNIDLAVDVSTPFGPEIRSQLLCNDRLVVIARAGHPALTNGLSLDAYLAEDHIVVSSRRRGLSLEDFELNRRGLARRVVLRCQSHLAACRAAARTAMLLTIPERHANALIAGLDMDYREFPMASAPMDLNLYWHAAVDDDPANAWLRAMVTAAIAPPDDRAAVRR